MNPRRFWAIVVFVSAVARAIEAWRRLGREFDA
jgi:hypothetical protein